MSLIGNRVTFRWNDTGIMQSNNTIDTSRWYHIRYGISEYKLYIDGIENGNGNGSIPDSNNMEWLLGAMDQANNPPNKPLDYYEGWMEELRIWSKALSADHIRQMMMEIK